MPRRQGSTQRRTALTPELLQQFCELLRGLPRPQGALAPHAWRRNDLVFEDDNYQPRREDLVSTLRLLADRRRVDLPGVLQDLKALKLRHFKWYVHGGHEDPRLGVQPDAWRRFVKRRDVVVTSLRKHIGKLRVNPLTCDVEGRDATNWVGAFERWLHDDFRAKYPAPPSRSRRGKPSLPMIKEGGRMLGRRGVPHGDREALLMAVGLIPYRE